MSDMTREEIANLSDHAFWKTWHDMDFEVREALPDDVRRAGIARYNSITDYVEKSVHRLGRSQAKEGRLNTGREYLDDDTARSDWPDPSRLPTGPTAQEFDYDLMPESLAGYVRDISERISCPPDYPAVASVVALGSVIGRKLSIQPKEFDDWYEVANLWGCIIGDPGVFKTPAISEALRPLKKIEDTCYDEYQSAMADWEISKEVLKVQKDAARANALREAKKPGGIINRDSLRIESMDEEPTARRLIVNDCTEPALGEVLMQNPNGVLAFRDELIGLLRSLDREGNESARAFFLSAWTGKEPHTTDRIGRGLNLRIPACCVSLFGGIQPSVLSSYLREAVKQSGGDGLMSRFQLLVWPRVSGDWENVDRFPNAKARSTAFEGFAGMDAGVFPQKLSDRSGIPYLRFSPDAQILFNEWRQKLERRLRSGEDHPAFVSHLSKYRSLVPKLALVMQIADNPKAESVSDEALLKALGWAEYLESHARKAYSSVTGTDMTVARAFLERIKSGSIKPRFSLKDVYNSGWSQLSDSDAVHKAAAILEDYDYLRSEHIPTGGRPKIEYTVNPKVCSQ